MRVPNSPSHTLGLVVWNNQPTAVLNLENRLGLGDRFENSHSHFLLCRISGGENSIGFPIGETARVLNLPLPHKPLNGDLPINRTFVRGVFETEEEILVIPDVDRMFSS